MRDNPISVTDASNEAAQFPDEIPPGYASPVGAGPLAPVELNDNALRSSPSVSIVVPTRNEMMNVESLLERLAGAFDPAITELLVIDDSDDATPEAFEDHSPNCPLPIRFLHRSPGARKGGLSSAVLTGAQHARGAWVLVMDADLQHPPEAAAHLAGVAIRHDADLVVGTRYAGGASPDGLDGAGRGLVSVWATRLAKSLFPRRLAMISDPLSGLFAFRRSSVDIGRLQPIGFKILLEVLVRNPVAKIAEVAYCFGPRQAGRSKASARQGLTFLVHLARLRTARLAGQLREGPVSRAERIHQALRFLAFGLVGLTGIGVNTAALWFFYRRLGWNHLIGASLATQASTTWNFLLIDGLIYRHHVNRTRAGRAARFFAMNNLLLLARLPVLQALVGLRIDVLAANAVTLALLFLVRFIASDRAIFGGSTAEPARDPVRILVDLSDAVARAGAGQQTTGRKRSRYLTYRYDVAGAVTIGSQILLPELEFFRAQWVSDDEVDIAVRVGDVGKRRPRGRAAMTEYIEPAAIRYEEHLGRLGANFRVYLGSPISVEIGPLLARSCHVVYTNIIEPLLRFVMISRDRMLLHSACVQLRGAGVMLSALTDTGKTGTVLRLVREQGAQFLSDDMTIIDADGNAYAFPKPLTISAHTLRAVQADDLTRSEWQRLQFQSRLHSKGGRSLGMALSRFNLPIMSLNALTQMVIPPPKYSVDRLVRCRLAGSTRVRELFVIERGSPVLAELDEEAALRQLITNTDDAYGFPPFRYLAPSISIDGQDYQQLRKAEREVLAGFLHHVRLRRLASDTFGWADEIPRLIGGKESGSSGDAVTPSGAKARGAKSLAAGQAPVPAPREPEFMARGATTLTAPPTRREDASRRGRHDWPPAVPAGPPRPRPTISKLVPCLTVALAAALAAVFRLWHLNALGFNSDEAVYAGQAAAIAGNPALHGLFPVFRAHPLLFQLAVSAIYRFGVSDLAPRLLAVGFGLATVAAGYAAGARCYGRRAGGLAALLLAVMPYLVVVNRQALLDGPMTFFSVMALWLLARFASGGRRSALFAAGAVLGLAFLSKETAIVLVPAAYAFLAVTPSVQVRLRDVALFFGCFAVVALPYPVSLALAGGSSTGQHFLTWELFRPANHAWTFYAGVVPAAIGLPVVACAAAMLGITALTRSWWWRESLLASWIVVPFLFFQAWPVKGFQYLLPLAPPIAILAAGLLTDSRLAAALGRGSAWKGRAAQTLGALTLTAWLAVSCWATVGTTDTTSFLAGTGGVPGGRAAGLWVRSHTPQGADMIALGPSMANILQFYGHRPVLGLSVSPNALHRNPAYQPIDNPDLLLRTGQVQYLVWDSFSAGRTRYFSQRLMSYVRRYHGDVVHVESVTVPSSSGPVRRPVIVIYEVRP